MIMVISDEKAHISDQTMQPGLMRQFSAVPAGPVLILS